MIQCLRLHASSVGGVGLIPGGETKIPHAMQCDQKNNSILLSQWEIFLDINVLKENKTPCDNFTVSLYKLF